jgi:hypothetical protein
MILEECQAEELLHPHPNFTLGEHVPAQRAHISPQEHWRIPSAILKNSRRVCDDQLLRKDTYMAE